MTRRTWESKAALATLAGLVCSMGCAGTPAGFHVSPREARDSVAVVAIARPFVPYDVVSIGDLRSLLERSLTARLEAAGLRVVASEHWEAAWRGAAEDVGGIYDAKTGEADDEKLEIVEETVYRDLAAGFGVDAVAHLVIEEEEHYGTWKQVGACGRWVPVYWPGGWRGGNTTLVRVACLNLLISDGSGRLLYGLRSPLEVVETLGHQTRAIRGPRELFQDPEAIAAAVDRIVEPFVSNEVDPD